MRRLIVIAFTGLSLAAGLAAQSKPPITRADYGQWESLGTAGARGGFSPDGRWITYAINRSSRNNELRLLDVDTGAVSTAAFGTQPAFSSDSKWVAWSLGYSEADQEKMRQDRKPIQNRLEIVNLGSGERSTVDGIRSFSFSRDGAYLAMQRYAPPRPGAAPEATPAGTGRGGRGGSTAGDNAGPGSTLLVRDLSSGRDTTFGNVASYAWQDADDRHLLALVISAEGQIGNGVHVFDPGTTVLRVLDSNAADYVDLSWRKDSADLALLRSEADDRHDDPTYATLAWLGLGTPAERHVALMPRPEDGMPADMRIVNFRRPSWSEDGRALFVGIAEWTEKPPTARGRGAGGRGGGSAAEAAGNGSAAEPDEPAGVDIWHWKDTTVMARQKLSAAADRRRNLLGAWHLETGRFVQLAHSLDEQVSPIEGTDRVYVEDDAPYLMSRSIGRPAADLYVADLATGNRTPLKTGINDNYAQTSPGGGYVLFLEDDQFWTIDLASRAVTNVTRSIPTSFVDRDSDSTGPVTPPFGVAGWTPGDTAVLLYDKHDIWRVPTDGSRATRLTNGAPDGVRHRLVRLDPDARTIDLDHRVYMSVFGLRSKKSGYAALDPGGTVTRLVWLDKNVTNLAKAPDEERYAYIAQDHDDSPDLFVGGPGLGDARQVTTTNPFQDRFAWSHSQLVDYKNDRGLPLQAALYYPAGYEPGRAYPMVVYLYEKLSDNVHRYVAPSDRDYYNTTVLTSQGYFVLQPDIVFTPREPGVSVVQSVTPAVKKIVDLGLIDPKRVGVVGHSWGGFDTAFLATHTSIFAAAVAGAPITDLVSNYGNHHWSSGIAETDHIETGQQRMVVPLYDDLPAYIRNSAVFNVQNMTTPLMIEVGDSDGTVFWHQGVELYNIARRAKKNVVMLVYAGEDHGLRQKKNQVDYQQRILAWFGHYLKGEPGPGWIEDGERFLEREAEVKRLTIRREP
jgi:dipeptidyl aminopeptidase/acylaminoacyl peptidase